MAALFSKLKKTYLAALVLARYGTTRPRVVTLADGIHQVAVNPGDPRARKKITADAVRKKIRRNQHFWSRAVSTFRPDVAVDVGANYGECLFGTDYPPETCAIGVEANPALLPFLETSRRLHPHADRIRIAGVLASATKGDDVTFYVDSHASGGSTAVAEVASMRGRHFEPVSIPMTTIDHLVADAAVSDRRSLVFKIDVEGHEPQVLAGMTSVLAEFESVVGFIEFDSRMLAHAGVCLETYWTRLTTDFDVFGFTRGLRLCSMQMADWAEAGRLIEAAGSHTDLLLVGGRERSRAHAFVSESFQLAAAPPRRAA